jgi:uncharacterized protein
MYIGDLLRAFLFIIVVGMVYALEVLYLLDWLKYKLGRNNASDKSVSRNQKIIKYSLHALALVGLICMAYGYFIEPYRLEVKYFKIHSPKLRQDKLRLVQISDLHCDIKQRNESKLSGIINGLRPDIVVFTGDSLNTSESLPVFKQTLSAIHARLGKFAVKGNYDIYCWSNLDLFGGTGFEELVCGSQAVSLTNETIYIAGLSCAWPDNWRQAVLEIPPDKFSVLLYHKPDLIEDVAQTYIDLYLTGHTHGGQVALPFYGAFITFSCFGKKYEAGQYQVGNTTLYVNRGVGMEGGIAPRVRFWSRPEITVFDIE